MPKKFRTWKVIGWDAKPASSEEGEIPLQCPHCDRWALVPTCGSAGVIILSVIGLGLVVDPPGGKVNPSFMPDTIQCRKCRRIFTEKDQSHE